MLRCREILRIFRDVLRWLKTFYYLGRTLRIFRDVSKAIEELQRTLMIYGGFLKLAKVIHRLLDILNVFKMSNSL